MKAAALLLVLALSLTAIWILSPSIQSPPENKAFRHSGNPLNAEAKLRHADYGRELPLPPADRPLKETLAQLVPAADAGNEYAACRLAMEYEYCSTLEQELSGLNKTLRSLGDSGEARRTGVVGLLATALEEKRRHCDGFDEKELGRVAPYWRTAALKGVLPAMVHYASGRAFRSQDTLRNLDELRVFQGNAKQLIDKAVRSGSTDAIWVLAEAQRPRGDLESGRSLLAQVVGQSGHESLVNYLLVKRAILAFSSESLSELPDVERRIEEVSSHLTAEEIGLASREANRRSIELGQMIDDLPLKGSILANPSLLPDFERCAPPGH